MPEWWTYRLSDLLLFSPETYFRLFELYHRDIWPLQPLAALLGVLVAALLLRRGVRWEGRAVAAILSLAWLWVAWAFLLQRYASINWAARWFAAAFALQALLLLWMGVMRNRLGLNVIAHPAQRFGILLFAWALLVHPLLGIAAGRAGVQAELFALTPDATALGTLGAVLSAGARVRVTLLVIPLLWCVISAATLLTMGSPEGWVIAGTCAIALASAIWRGRSLQED